MDTGVYSNRQIFEAHNSGNIVIDPFNPNQVNGSSYDVRLGEYFYTIKDKSELKPAIFNPYDQQHVDNHFEGPFKAKMLRGVIDTLGITKPNNIELEDQVIILQPGQRILGHTEEFIGIKNGTTSMQARSTSGRLGINVCQDAGWGDPGYINRWTMEIYNNNSLDPIILVVGTRIAQIVFMHTGIVDGEYSDLSGNYQTSSASDLASIKSSWLPTQMKPKPLTLK
ncbi:dCTP deaminase [Candidatus Saccharibacteria bacterium]|jgi:deoxycytidine triphosphate deaminase|nr:dCTP deaminase [Candidatus Saccharibacteria bacterium]MBP7834679.1 dCTP deaminase [Candidatus Saccharibacteria bacterium]